jgi:5,10-methenyltetrahydromethanopterin hydrogenase
MTNPEPFDVPWQNELYEFIDDEFEKQVLAVAIREMNPESILQNVREIIREKLHEDTESED